MGHGSRVRPSSSRAHALVSATWLPLAGFWIVFLPCEHGNFPSSGEIPPSLRDALAGHSPGAAPCANGALAEIGGAGRAYAPKADAHVAKSGWQAAGGSEMNVHNEGLAAMAVTQSSYSPTVAVQLLGIGCETHASWLE